MRRNCDSGSSINRSPLTTSSCSRENTSNQRCMCKWYIEIDNGRYASFTVPFGSITNSSKDLFDVKSSQCIIFWNRRAKQKTIRRSMKMLKFEFIFVGDESYLEIGENATDEDGDDADDADDDAMVGEDCCGRVAVAA